MKRFAVIGAGSFGFYVSKALFESNQEVITIDRNREIGARVSDLLS